MKIGSIDAKPVVQAPVSERRADAAPVASTEPSAKVELSSAASLVVTGAGDGSFDAAKVDRIATAIRDGNYKVNPEAIADKMIVNAEELLGRKLS
ncbi:MAG: flagellar biosynthesis anti-sigma factor FlgM [Pseudomonadota bacterium]